MRTQFIHQRGTAALQHHELQSRTETDKKVASQQVPPPETYKVIEESPTRVIAEVEGNLFELLLRTSCFLVVMVDDEWKLDDIFWSCTCKKGVCFACRGNGHCTYCNGRGFTRRAVFLKRTCVLCHGKARCKFCSGTGQCDHCIESPIPGWVSRSRDRRVESKEDPPTTEHH